MDETNATPTPEQLAWAAGLFEGEGCMNAYPRGKRGSGCQVRLGMTDLDVVQRFAALMECGNIHAPNHDRWPRKQQGHKPLHQWVVYEASQVIRVIEMLLPYFGERRSAKAREVLAVARDIKTANADKTHCPEGHALEGENLMLEPIKRTLADGSVREYTARRCKVCRVEQMRRNYVARREGATNG